MKNWHDIIKVATGIIVVPLAIIVHGVWPWWERTPLPVKIISGIVVLPLVGLVALLSNWWSSY